MADVFVPTNSPAKDVADYLEEVYPWYCGKIHIGFVADGREETISLFDAGGSPPAYSTGEPLRTKYLQVRVKSMSYTDAQTLLDKISYTLELKHDGILNQKRYRIFRKTSEPMFMGKDNVGLFHWSVDFEIDIQEI